MPNASIDPHMLPGGPGAGTWRKWAFGLTAVVVGVPAAILLGLGLPAIDPTANALRPQHSPAYAALEEVQNVLDQKREPLWLIVGGRTEAEVANRLALVQAALTRASSNGVVAEFTLPTSLWPRPENQSANRRTALELAGRAAMIRQAAAAAGFADRSQGLLEGALETWQRAAHREGSFWPSNPLSQWILEKVTTRTPTNNLAVGMLHLRSSGPALGAQIAQLRRSLPGEGVWISGWQLLGPAIFSRVQANLGKVLIPMAALVLLSLWLAFHRFLELLLSLGALLLSGLCLLAFMRLTHWSWNLLNLMAVPLILGTGVDYSIFMQSALRRHGGDLRLAHFAVGRALLLCGATAIAGFGSLAWSSNSGMASLGRVCAIGIGGNMLIAVFLLPAWWHALAPGLDAPGRFSDAKLHLKD